MSIVKRSTKPRCVNGTKSCRKNAAIVPVCGVAQRLMMFRREGFRSLLMQTHTLWKIEAQEWRFTALRWSPQLAPMLKLLMNGSLLPRSWRR